MMPNVNRKFQDIVAKAIADINTIDIDETNYSDSQILTMALTIPDGTGLRLAFETVHEAYLCRMRLYKVRWRDRLKSRRLPFDDAAWGRSAWDVLGIYLPRGTTHVVIVKLPQSAYKNFSRRRNSEEQSDE